MLRESWVTESSRLKMAIQWFDELRELVVNQKKYKMG